MEFHLQGLWSFQIPRSVLPCSSVLSFLALGILCHWAVGHLKTGGVIGVLAVEKITNKKSHINLMHNILNVAYYVNISLRIVLESMDIHFLMLNVGIISSYF